MEKLDLLTLPEVAKVLRVRTITVWQWCAKLEIPHFDFNGCKRISKRDLAEWIKDAYWEEEVTI